MIQEIDGVRFGQALAHIKVPLFLARRSEVKGRPLVTLHTTDRKTSRALARQADAALRAEGIDAATKVVVHRAAKLTRFRSLEALTGGLGNGDIVFDPTRFIARSESIVSLGKTLRRTLPRPVTGIFVEASRRALFVIVDRDAYAPEASVQTAEQAETLKIVTESVRAWQVENAEKLDLSIRVGFEPPAGTKLISVDSLTVKSTFRSLLHRGFRKHAVKVGLASLFGLTAAIPAAAQEPAVSAPNASAVIAGRLFDETHFGEESPWGGVGVKAAIPLGNLFGFQADAAVGTYGYYGFGGHLFWRDPSMGLVGAFASYEENEADDMTRVGAEAEAYIDRFTVRGIAGHQSGSVQEGFFGNLDVIFYATPNFSLTAGAITDPGQDLYGHAGFEWQPAVDGLVPMSIFADGQFGSEDRTQVTAGLKFHFGGGSKTLMDRARRDDPELSLFHLPLGYK
jgi:hypothetical protein